ncbi:MAG: hypothetical protein M1365_17040 [Actinobacteria bacterium]|nr:hypothetical protein [Actinomycetota bacterium]
MDKHINYKEIFNRTINHEKGRSFLLDFGGDQASISIFVYKQFLDRIGINRTPGINSLVQLSSIPEKEFLAKYNIGFRWLYPKSSKRSRILLDKYKETVEINIEEEIKRGYVASGKGKIFKDEWGVTWKRSAYYFEMTKHPLEGMSFEEIKKYKFPDPQDSSRTKGLANELQNYLDENLNYIISLSQSYGGILETALWLRGFMDFYIDIASNSRECRFLLDSITEYFIEWNSNYLKAVDGKVDILAVGDDYGMQDRTIMSPEIWRKQIKPRYQKMIKNIKSKYQDLKWFHHTCGSVFPIIGDMIEIGVDILNPIQPTALDMQPEKLKKTFGNNIIFHGGIDIQKLLPFGKPDEIRNEVKRVINILSENGGYIAAPSHNIQALTPVENIIALYETVNDMFTEINGI